MAALALAVVTAWFKMKPAMRKIESEEDSSLRTDLLKRISQLETDMSAERKVHQEVLDAMRKEHADAIVAMTSRHNDICRDYEQKLVAFQARMDVLMDRLIEQTARNLQ
jgi:hypothetical protein